MKWMWPWSWWRRPAGPPAEVVLYTRRGCHLCEDAWGLLEQAARRYPLRLSQTDVDTDPTLAAAYGLEVPVILVNGRVRFRGRINPVLLERLLRAESRSRG
jgi:hypothetical protein